MQIFCICYLMLLAMFFGGFVWKGGGVGWGGGWGGANHVRC